MAKEMEKSKLALRGMRLIFVTPVRRGRSGVPVLLTSCLRNGSLFMQIYRVNQSDVPVDAYLVLVLKYSREGPQANFGEEAS
jgi:hypothetical protein